MDKTKAISLLMILFSIALAVGGQFLLKIGMTEVGTFKGGDLATMRGFFVKTFTQSWVLLGLSLYVISSISWLVVLSRVELSFAYPLAALGYVAAIAIASFALGEAVTAIRWAGALLICLGVVLISRS